MTTGRLVGIDRDPQALGIARERLKDYEQRVTLVQADFSRIDEVAAELGLGPVNGVIADLGVSSLQLDTAERGFSFRSEGPLDMRMDSNAEVTAAEIVNQTDRRVNLPTCSITSVRSGIHEESPGQSCARGLYADTAHLATVVAGARKSRGRQKLHPATKTFLALRIAVNREMEELGQFLNRVPATLSPGGRWVVLSYHSLEDRMVKQEFQQLSREGEFEVLTRKVVRPSDAEIAANPRARSAKMRVAEKSMPEPSSAEW